MAAVTLDRLYFRQLLSGRDFAEGDPMARQMVNFVYAVGDRESGEAVIVDPAYAVGDLLDVLAADDMRCVGVLATHYHADHVGGTIGRLGIEGIAALLELVEVPIHVQRDEVPWVERTTGVGAEPSRRPRQRRRGAGRRRSRSSSCTRRATPRAASASWSTGASCRATPCSSTGAAGPTCPGSDPVAMYELADHAPRAGPRRHRALPGPPLLARALGPHGRRRASATSSSRRAPPTSGSPCSAS